MHHLAPDPPRFLFLCAPQAPACYARLERLALRLSPPDDLPAILACIQPGALPALRCLALLAGAGEGAAADLGALRHPGLTQLDLRNVELPAGFASLQQLAGEPYECLGCPAAHAPAACWVWVLCRAGQRQALAAPALPLPRRPPPHSAPILASHSLPPTHLSSLCPIFFPALPSPATGLECLSIRYDEEHEAPPLNLGADLAALAAVKQVRPALSRLCMLPAAPLFCCCSVHLPCME